MVYPCMCSFSPSCRSCRGSGVREDRDPNLVPELRKLVRVAERNLEGLRKTLRAVEEGDAARVDAGGTRDSILDMGDDASAELLGKEMIDGIAGGSLLPRRAAG